MRDAVVVAHVPGWMMFDRLYALSGTLYVVMDDPALVLDRSRMVLSGCPTTDPAKMLFGSGADVLGSVTVRLLSPEVSFTH